MFCSSVEQVIVSFLVENDKETTSTVSGKRYQAMFSNFLLYYWNKSFSRNFAFKHGWRRIGHSIHWNYFYMTDFTGRFSINRKIFANKRSILKENMLDWAYKVCKYITLISKIPTWEIPVYSVDTKWYNNNTTTSRICQGNSYLRIWKHQLKTTIALRFTFIIRSLIN